MNKNKKILIGFGVIILAFGALWLISEKSKKINFQNNLSVKISPTQENPAFIDTIWSISLIENNKPIPQSSITVQFNNDGRVTGFDGCNNFNSTYTVNGEKIKINSPAASTLKACAANIMNQANAFNKLLFSSTSFSLGEGTLALNQGNSTGLNFSGSTNPIAKTSWDVTGYNNGNQAVVSPIIDTNPTITFGDDGTISGSAGCNTYSGKYSISGQSITISTLATTRRECIEPEGIMEQESSFLTYLQKANTWSLQGNMLSLRTAEDQLAVTGVSSAR